MNERRVGRKFPLRLKNGHVKAPMLGPVANLEDHVNPEWWRSIFDSLYLKTDADVVDDQSITRDEVQFFLKVANVGLESRILDLCCGQGRHALEMARRGFINVEGLDRSRYLVQKARSQAARERLDVKLREGDARKPHYPDDSFDCVMILGNSFGYFDTDLDDLHVLKEVFRILVPGGLCLLDVADGEYLRKQFQSRSWEWLDKKHFVCRERSLSADAGRLISREVVTNVCKGVIADRFYAERLYSKEGILSLLEQAGFRKCAVQGEISTNSVRNQDLGMMKQRIIVTASVEKAVAPLRLNRSRQERNVVVVLGDPRKPDLLKPSALFDDDDFETVERAKTALAELRGYRFRYLDNHDTLVQDLKKIIGKVDFMINFCDEGFNNDPRQELHVPALCEQLNLPYTGSGPQCLAYCYDKSLVRGIAKEMKIPVPRAFFVRPEDSTFELPFSFPVIVKPNFGDASFGITQRSVANNLEETLNAISELRHRFGYDKPLLVEEFLTGSDLSVGIIGNPLQGYTVLPVSEEDYGHIPEDLPRICAYEAKWRPDSPYWRVRTVPACLPDDLEKSIIEWCLRLFDRLECRDYCRLDWRLDATGNPRLLEVNPNPGWCWDGHLAKMACFAGMSYAGMLEAILKAAERRLGFEPVGPTRTSEHTLAFRQPEEARSYI
jgi:D-alanine-D-alanine ligase